VLFAVLGLVLTTAIPVLGNVLPQRPPTGEKAQGGSYPITEFSQNRQVNSPVYSTGIKG